MILADTSLWIEHFRCGNQELHKQRETRHLYGLGIGLIDAHLIASVLIDPPTLLWTKDKKLRKTAESLGIHVRLP